MCTNHGYHASSESGIGFKGISPCILVHNIEFSLRKCKMKIQEEEAQTRPLTFSPESHAWTGNHNLRFDLFLTSPGHRRTSTETPEAGRSTTSVASCEKIIFLLCSFCFSFALAGGKKGTFCEPFTGFPSALKASAHLLLREKLFFSYTGWKRNLPLCYKPTRSVHASRF